MALFKRKQKEEKEEPQKIDEQSIVIPSTPALPKGGDADAYGVVLSPHITEKATLMSEQNKYIFKIANNASKVEAKKAVESLYKVEVEKVRVVYAKSKLRMVGRRQGAKPGFKKAIVTLKEGSKIDLAT